MPLDSKFSHGIRVTRSMEPIKKINKAQQKKINGADPKKKKKKEKKVGYFIIDKAREIMDYIALQ